MNNIRIISVEKDGADLRREENRSKYTVRCDGKADEQEINEAIQSVRGEMWGGLGKAWDRIFGEK